MINNHHILINNTIKSFYHLSKFAIFDEVR